VNNLRALLLRNLARVVLFLIYSIAVVISLVTKRLYRKKTHSGRIIINATFHNPNWFYAHIEPVARANYGEVILVTDEVIAEIPNLVYKCPPKWLSAIFTRAGAKAIWVFLMGCKYPADLFMGYHIFPSAITALICGRLLGAKCAYQVTAGELELEGGGWNAENKLMTSLLTPSALIEKMALSVTNQFDLVVVRGSNAKQFILKGGYQARLEVITGSVELPELDDDTTKDIDIIFVGRLAEYKRPEIFVDVIHQLTNQFPAINAVMVGDGPDRDQLESKIQQLGLNDNLDLLGQRGDVMTLLGRSKIFVLTSRWEGVSIAMLEAMGLGLVPVVSKVGDLADFAINDSTGYTIEHVVADNYSEVIGELLSSPEKYDRLSAAARQLILDKAERNRLAKRWAEVITTLVNN